MQRNKCPSWKYFFAGTIFCKMLSTGCKVMEARRLMYQYISTTSNFFWNLHYLNLSIKVTAHFLSFGVLHFCITLTSTSVIALLTNQGGAF